MEHVRERRCPREKLCEKYGTKRSNDHVARQYSRARVSKGFSKGKKKRGKDELLAISTNRIFRKYDENMTLYAIGNTFFFFLHLLFESASNIAYSRYSFVDIRSVSFVEAHCPALL